jgi:hypothetical protein
MVLNPSMNLGVKFEVYILTFIASKGDSRVSAITSAHAAEARKPIVDIK